ncbi:hypothetical protein Mapa_003824 [Marchantia paleacea]|nr:hypothetical protein Mapa_003824 [Marchantia paleacea]
MRSRCILGCGGREAERMSEARGGRRAERGGARLREACEATRGGFSRRLFDRDFVPLDLVSKGRRGEEARPRSCKRASPEGFFLA